MSGKTKKSQLMASWNKKWGKDAGLKRKIGDVVGSINKSPQVEHLVSEYSDLSRAQAEKKMMSMGFSPSERKRLIEGNDELSRVFGVNKDGNVKLSKSEMRRIAKKEEMHKKYNIRSSRDVSTDIEHKKKNPLEGIYKKAKESNSIGARLHSDEGDHEVTALGKNRNGTASITQSGEDNVVRSSQAKGLTGGASSFVPKGNTPFKGRSGIGTPSGRSPLKF